MTSKHSVESIDTHWIDLHIDEHELNLSRLKRTCSEIDQIFSGDVDRIWKAYGADSSGSSVVATWQAYDRELRELCDRISQYPGGELTTFKPYGESEYISCIVLPDGSVPWESILANSQERLVAGYDDQFLITNVHGVPSEIRRAALDRWVSETLADVPLFSQSVSVSVEAQVAWVEIGFDAVYKYEIMHDGEVQLTLDVSGKLGAGIDVQGFEASAGVEGGVELTYGFENQAEADAFLDELRGKLLRGKLISITPDIAGAAQLLSNRSYLEGLVTSIGAYAEIEAEFGSPQWAGGDASASISVRYGRDFISDEDIMYAKGSASLGAHAGGAGVGIAAGFEAEQRWNSEGESTVSLQCSFETQAGGNLKELLPGLDVSTMGGATVDLSIELMLDDPAAKNAWEAFVNPLDGSLDLTNLIHQSGATIRIAGIVNGGADHEFDGPFIEIDVSVELESTTDVWVKAPGGDFQKVVL